MKRRARALRTAVLAATLIGTAACGTAGLSPTAATGSVGGSPSSAPPTAETAPGGQTALAVLATLPVKGRAPLTGYDRAAFGQPWADVDRNGCGTRDDILARDLTGTVVQPGTGNCVVLNGTLADPYTGTSIAFARGDGSSVDIDHVVALGNAWQTGAFAWDTGKRTALANDPLNLLAVDYSANRQKGDGDAATWLPPDKSYRCAYVARQVAVKAAYGLWVTPAERDASARVLQTCPDQPVPSSAAATVPAAVPPSVSTPAPGPGYPNCAAVRAAGAAPLHRGDPGYSTRMDGDGDGTACE